jgi:hypothetical protein
MMALANDVTFISEPVGYSPVRPTIGRLGNLAFVIFASWLFPGRTARRTLSVSLPACWALHILVGICSALFIAGGFIAVEESPMGVLRTADDALAEWGRNPITVSLVLLGIFVWIELALLALAFVVVAWGGIAGERLRDSYRHAVKQVWLRTPHAALIALLIGTFVLIIDTAGDRWKTAHPQPESSIWPTWPNLPAIPEGDPNYPAAKKKYDQEMEEYQKKSVEAGRSWQQWRMTQPWPIRHEEQLAIIVGCLGAAWWLAALLLAVGIRRDLASEQQPGLCLWCGYDLHTMPLDSRCPECGQAVADSLGDHAQPGAAWENIDRAGRVSSWWHTWRLALKDPVTFGRSLRLGGFRDDHRTFLLLHLPAIFFTGAAGLASGALFNAPPGDIARDWAILFLIMAIFAGACVLGTVLVVCGSASLVGWILSLQARRNLLPASMQVAAYLTSYLVAWAFFGAALINAVIHLNVTGMMGVAQDLTGIHADFLSFITIFGSNLMCGLAYLWIVARGTKAARHANA